jgi:hypothetical protein
MAGASECPPEGRARIAVVDAPGVREYESDGGPTVFSYARAYTDDRSSGAAHERGRAKISERENTSLFRVGTPWDEKGLAGRSVAPTA